MDERIIPMLDFGLKQRFHSKKVQESLHIISDICKEENVEALVLDEKRLDNGKWITVVQLISKNPFDDEAEGKSWWSAFVLRIQKELPYPKLFYTDLSEVQFGKQDIRGGFSICFVNEKHCVTVQKLFASRSEMIGYIIGFVSATRDNCWSDYMEK